MVVDKARSDRLGALVVFLCGNLWASEALFLTPPVARRSTLSFVRQPTRVFFKPDDEFKDLMEEMEAEKEAKAQAEAAALEEEESVEDISQAQQMAAFLSARLGAAVIKAQQQKKTESTVASSKDEADEKEEHISVVKEEEEEEEPVADGNGEPLVQKAVEEKAPSVAPVSNEEPALDEEKKSVVMDKEVGEKLVPEVVEKKPIVVEEVAIPEEEEKKPVEMIEEVGEKLVPEVVKEKKPELVSATEDESAVEEKVVKTEASSEKVTGEDEVPDEIEEETENLVVAEEESEVHIKVEEHGESLHIREGDRVVALKDEFSTHSLPEVVSIEFGRPLEVVQSGVPPLSEKELADITNASSKVAKVTRSALEGTAAFVETEFTAAPKILLSVDEVPSDLDDIEQAEALEETKFMPAPKILRPVDEDPSELDDTDEVEEPDNAILASEEVVQLERLMEKSKPEELTLEDQAFNILVELGMIKLTPDPNSPAYDHSADNEYCPENVYTNFDESLLTAVGASVSESTTVATETETIMPSSEVVVERVELADLNESVDMAK